MNITKKIDGLNFGKNLIFIDSLFVLILCLYIVSLLETILNTPTLNEHRGDSVDNSCIGYLIYTPVEMNKARSRKSIPKFSLSVVTIYSWYGNKLNKLWNELGRREKAKKTKFFLSLRKPKIFCIVKWDNYFTVYKLETGISYCITNLMTLPNLINLQETY